MQPETEQILGTLQVIVEPYLTVDLPGHENGGTIVPFVWDVSEQGEFNVINLCLANGWLQLTDVDITIQSWQDLEYLKYFHNFSLGFEDKNLRTNKFADLLQILHTNLQDLESFSWKVFSQNTAIVSPGLVIGRTADGIWICICPTVYKETAIPQELISRSALPQSTSGQLFGENSLKLISQIQKITSELGTISIEGDFGGGYYYKYDHQIIYGVAVSKELAFEQALQNARLLELKQFNGFYLDKTYFEGCNYDDSEEDFYTKYEQINKLLKQMFFEVIMYRFSFWTQEHIYIIAQTNPGDWVGLFINSEFVYNP